jgi:fido (protein-threonine AMPylation protein)
LPIPWNSDPPAARRQIEANIADLLVQIRDTSRDRQAPRISLAQDWHRLIYRNVAVPVPYYVGEIRDSDSRFPELIGYGVQVGATRGVPSAQVPRALAGYESGIQTAIGRVDALVPLGEKPLDSPRLTAVVELAAVAHGEWVRIHPFANGNGRTARLWVAWIAARYRLPLFLSIKPRPDSNLYAIAAQFSMMGNHGQMALYLGDRLEEALRAERG